ncbi:GNAT family N-acetyltransferase [Veronia pacifica]|uniref:Acetyltransferase n=1 Tax=Veronia pacifica TaxID=1080227 RepID=A0A1C3ELE6_9GAMM|nr:GNAT family N-acetyltransferase [Veronia pacifica]ODA34051.1 acetyltransferase [Veronia pacifica]
MIHIERLTESHIDAVKLITLADEQVKFAGTSEEFLADGDATTHLFVIISDDTVVGFFKIDTAYASNYHFCPETGLGLRAFVIDRKQQGKGLGTASVKALIPSIKQHYPQRDCIYLTVNCKNPAAKACYLKGGFTDTGEKYLGGAAGPQNIMNAELNALTMAS